MVTNSKFPKDNVTLLISATYMYVCGCMFVFVCVHVFDVYVCVYVYEKLEFWVLSQNTFGLFWLMMTIRNYWEPQCRNRHYY